MTLKVAYDTKEDIPEGYLEAYSQKDGKWTLQAEGIKTQEDVDRAMDAMRKQKDLRIDAERDLAKFKEVDLEKWEKVKDLDPDADPGQGLTPEKVREIEETFRTKYAKKETELQSKIDSAEKKAKDYVKDSWIRKMLSEKFGFESPRRLNDFIRGMGDDLDPDFRAIRKAIDSLKVAEENGSFKVIGGDIGDSEGAKESLEAIAKSDIAKHYMPAPENSGGGSNNKHREGSDNQVNPYKEDSWNLTNQAKIEKDNPALAKKQAAEAGVEIE